MRLNATTTAAPGAPAPANPAAHGAAPAARVVLTDFRVFQHSNLIYWWVLWVWGYICAGLTYFGGTGIAVEAMEGKRILFYAESWLGLSYIGVLLIVAVFTNLRARGVYSFVLVTVMVALVWGARHIPGYDQAVGWLPLLRVHMNLAFYMTTSTLLMLLWVIVVFVIDHLTWHRFSPGQVIEEHLFGQATGLVYSTDGMVARRLPDDFFRHRILGLGLLRFGTGDFIVHPANGDTFELHNVWRANEKQKRMEIFLATKFTTTR